MHPVSEIVLYRYIPKIGVGLHPREPKRMLKLSFIFENAHSKTLFLREEGLALSLLTIPHDLANTIQ